MVSRSSPSADEQEQTAGKVGDDESRKSDGRPPREVEERSMRREGTGGKYEHTVSGARRKSSEKRKRKRRTKRRGTRTRSLSDFRLFSPP